VRAYPAGAYPVGGILITGGSSYLGQHLVPLALALAEPLSASQRPPSAEVCYTYHSSDPLALPQGRRLDLRDRTAVHDLIHTRRPAVIIHTAGSNRTPDMAAVIRQGTQFVTEAAAAVGARLIHISTDSIFDGRQPPYSEASPPTPIHAYGRAKADAEAIVAAYPDHVIVRPSLIYSPSLIDRSTEWITAALCAGQPVTLFTNQIRNPVSALTLSRACLELAGHAYRGILNVAGRQVLSRAEFGLKLLDYWGIEERGGLTLAPSADDQWPLDCRLDLSLATSLLQTPLLGVDEVLTIR
jgi:dTDP-4-dehydrorhamnose reductase